MKQGDETHVAGMHAAFATDEGLEEREEEWGGAVVVAEGARRDAALARVAVLWSREGMRGEGRGQHAGGKRLYMRSQVAILWSGFRRRAVERVRKRGRGQGDATCCETAQTVGHVTCG